MNWPFTLPVTVVFATLCVAGIADWRQFKVGNWITIPFVLSGLFYHTWTQGWSGLGESVVGMLFGMGILLLFYVLGGMGAGDVKLMAGGGAWLGMPLTLGLLIAGGLAAGIYALILIVVSARVGDTYLRLKILWLRLRAVGRYLGSEERVETAVQAPDRRTKVVPFAAMLAVGMAVWLGLAVWLRP